MFVVVKVQHTGAGQGGKTPGRVKVRAVFNCALYFYRAHKVAAKPGSQPLFYPLKKAGRIADDIAEKPVDGANFFGFERKGVMADKAQLVAERPYV